MKKSEEKLQVVTLKVPVRMLQKIAKLRAEMERQDPSRAYSRSDAMRLALERSLSGDAAISSLKLNAEADGDTSKGEKGKAKGG
jgi:hypothetical protein